MNQEISRSEYSQSEKLIQIGSYLQDVRQEQGLSIEQIAAKTKIQARLLREIEVGNLDGLPEAIYVRGFLKRYAEFLGLNGHDISRSFPLYPDTGDLEPTWQNSDVAQLRQTHLYLAYIALITVAVIGLGSVLTRLSSGDRPTPNRTVVEAPVPDASTGAGTDGLDPAKDSTSVEASSDVTPPPPATENQPEQGAEPTTPDPDPVAATDADNTGDVLDSILQPSGLEDDLLTPALDPDIRDKPIQVELELKDRSWLRVIVDGRQDFEGVLPEGTQRTWAGDSNVVVRAGNAGGVLASLNGAEAEPMGNPGAVSERNFSTADIGTAQGAGQ